VVAALAAGSVTVLPQDKSKVTRAPKLRKEDGRIDWSQPAQAIHNLVRAMQPWPVAYTTWQPQLPVGRDPLRLIVHKTLVVTGHGAPGEVLESSGGRLVVAAGEGAVSLEAIQLPGKRILAPAEFLRGHQIQPGERFGA
jgi:methionyl-tRNA formyltransferase